MSEERSLPHRRTSSDFWVPGVFLSGIKWSKSRQLGQMGWSLCMEVTRKGWPKSESAGGKNISCPQISERFRLVFHGPGGEIGYLRIPNEKDFLIWYIVKSIVAVWRWNRCCFSVCWETNLCISKIRTTPYCSRHRSKIHRGLRPRLSDISRQFFLGFFP